MSWDTIVKLTQTINVYVEQQRWREVKSLESERSELLKTFLSQKNSKENIIWLRQAVTELFETNQVIYRKLLVQKTQLQFGLNKLQRGKQAKLAYAACEQSQY